MRLLKLPNSRLNRVAYTGPQSVLTADTQFSPYVPVVTRVWDLASGGEPLAIPQDQGHLCRLLFRPGGAQFLRARGAWPASEPLPPVACGAEVERVLVVGQNSPLVPFAFGPDGSVLYRHAGNIESSYQTHFYLKTPDGTVHDFYRVWGMFTTSAEFSPDGRLVAMSNGMRVVAVWDVATRRELFQIEQSDTVNALTFVSNEQLVVAAGRSVRLWDITSGRSVSKFRAFRKFADAVIASHDRKLFAAGDRDGVVRVWDTASGREVKEYNWSVGSIRCLAFSPDGATAAAVGATTAVIWDID